MIHSAPSWPELERSNYCLPRPDRPVLTSQASNQSYLVLYQAGRACCVNGRGATLIPNQCCSARYTKQAEKHKGLLSSIYRILTIACSVASFVTKVGQIDGKVFFVPLCACFSDHQMMTRPLSAVGYRRPLSHHARMAMMLRSDIRYKVSCASTLCFSLKYAFTLKPPGIGFLLTENLL